MTKHAFLSLIGLLFLSPLNHLYSDNDHLYFLNIEGGDKRIEFAFQRPIDWKETHAIPPFHYAFTDKTEECKYYLNFSAYEESVTQDHLIEEISLSLEALYGENFLKSPSYNYRYYNDENKDCVCLLFYWRTENKVESVLAIAYQRGNHSVVCNVITRKNEEEGFNSQKVFELLFARAEEIIKGVRCFERKS